MGLLDDARAYERNHMRCAVEIMLATLENPDHSEFIEALADQTIYATHLANVMKRRGYVIAKDAIQRHRRHECKCS